MSPKTKFPLYFPGSDCEINRSKSLVAADLRNSNSTLALYECSEGEVVLKQEKSYPTKEYSSFSELAKAFLEEFELSDIDKISVAVPGPVIEGVCETPNLPWTVDSSQVKEDLQMERVLLINDLEATAYSLTDVYDSKFEILHSSPNRRKGNVAIIAPGNGLGEAGLFYDGVNLRPFATEGGHTEFSPRNDLEVQFYQFLNKIYGIVTWETVLSKSGLYNIYRFLRDIGRHEEEEWLTERLRNEEFTNVIVSVAKEKKSRLVKLTVQMFLDFLARECNALVLKLKATGGLIITGEIPVGISSLIDKDKFYKSFLISDRMEHLLKDIPIYLLQNEYGILEGAAYYGAFYEKNS